MKLWLFQAFLLSGLYTKRCSSSAMPIGSFFGSMFFSGSTDDDDPPPPIVVESASEAVQLRRDFVLDTTLYSEFNEIGHAQFSILKNKGLDSPCWREAAAVIEADCQTMSHTRKQRLAVQLSNCHLQDTGRRRTRCWPADSDQRCVEETRHDDVAFHSYTTFFHHVNVICYHLSHSNWQHETEALVQGLTASSLATFERTERSLEKQEQVLEAQRLAAEQSESMAESLGETRADLAGLSSSLAVELGRAVGEIEKQETLMTSLVATQAAAANQAASFSAELINAKSELQSYLRAIEEDRRAAQAQNNALADTIGFIHDCLENATSAWSRFQAFTYMILSVNLCWVMTTPPPLRSARTALFVLVALGLLLEKFLCEDVSVFGSHLDAVVLPEWLAAGLRIATSGRLAALAWTKILLQEHVRWLTFQACCVVLVHAFVSYFVPFLGVVRMATSIKNISSWMCHTAFGLARLLFGRPTPRYLPKGCARLGHGEASGVSAIEGLYEPCRSPSEVTCSPGGSEFGAGPAEGFGESPGAELSGGSLRTPRERNGPGPRSSTRPRGPGGAEHADNEVEGEETSPDGLERLSRKELQELAARTNGRVKGNISTAEMIRALRREGADVVASEP